MSLHRETGFSLVEVILALALLGSVLIAVSGLFTLGARQVYSGRTHSTALAVARDIVEQMNGWAFHQTYREFELDPNSSGNSAGPTIDSRDPASVASRWQAILDDQLPDAHAGIRIESVAEGGGPPLKDALALRVVVTVQWTEGARSRTVQLAMVRI